VKHRYLTALLALLVCCSLSQAGPLPPTVSLNALSNQTTAFISFNNGTQSGSNEDVYVSQFQMTYTPAQGAPSSTLYTYCVDLPHDEQWNTPYAVTPTSLATVFGATNGDRIGYLYHKYGSTNLAGKAVDDAALQLALWDLSLTNHTPTSFGLTGNVYSSGDPSIFAVSGISSDIANQTNFYLNDAAQNATSSSSDFVYVGFTGPESNGSLQQSILIDPTPEPSALVAAAISGVAFGLYGLARRFRNKKETVPVPV
jgi:hypothetical protein